MIDLARIPGNHKFRLVDVGARGGVQERWLGLGSRLEAVLFEPDPVEYQRLREASPAHWRVVETALAGSPGVKDFHVLRHGGGSSFLLPDETVTSRYAGITDLCHLEKTISIQVDTLDHVLAYAGGPPGAHFIKIDTQGSELDILKGAAQTLETVIGLEIEVEFIPIYRDQPLFSDIDQYLRSRGFDLFDLGRHYWQRTGPDDCWPKVKGQLAYGDALYFIPPEVINRRARSEEEIWLAFAAYLAYGYPDTAYALIQGALENNTIEPAQVKKAMLLLNPARRPRLPFVRGRNRIHRFLDRFTQAVRPDSTSRSDIKVGN